MQHSLEIEGFGTRLRPVRMADAAFIVWLRNLEHAKGRVGDSAQDVAGQEKWMEAYFQRAGDYYFIIETQSGLEVGAYGIYDVGEASAESGRWVIRPDAPAAIPSAILAFDLAFNKLALTELRVRTVATNQPVLSLNRKFGFSQTRIEPGAQIINGIPIDMVHFVMHAGDWPKFRERLLPMARVAEKQLEGWEKAQNRAAK